MNKTTSKNNRDNTISRRTFLKSTAAIGLSGIAANVPFSQALAATKAEAERLNKETITHEFQFRKGKFKIMQITDTHYIKGDERSRRSFETVSEIIESEHPDLVIHTGDVISDGNTRHQIDAIGSMEEILGVVSDHKVPFAVALGNHDGQFGVSRHDIFEAIKTLPYNINRGVEGIYGDSNDLITLTSEKGGVPKWAFFLFDSGDSTSLKNVGGWSYDYIHFDQIAWYRAWSERFFKANGERPVPALAFMHIPVPEYTYALHDGEGHFHRILKGNLGEEPCPPLINSGLFTAMKEMDDVKAIVCGHDHDNDYAMKWKEMLLLFGRFSGGDTVYNHLKPNGARIFEFTEGKETFRSWIHEHGGQISQDLILPDAFNEK